MRVRGERSGDLKNFYIDRVRGGVNPPEELVFPTRGGLFFDPHPNPRLWHFLSCYPKNLFEISIFSVLYERLSLCLLSGN